MAAGLGMAQDQSFEVNVKDFQGSSVVIKVQPEWNVAMVKQEIARRANFNPQEFRIVFAGQTLDDGARLWVGHGSAHVYVCLCSCINGS
jgi:hypothetical protein